ncbi:MAG TPA: abortive infection family protein [Desulfosporosinus sp.]|nr:abortive infection family protein [Desulfosporosinus sp.]
MKISEITRRNIIDTLRLENVIWNGRLEEVDFLSRLYHIDELPSYDGRFTSMSGDIYQHRVNNYDWQDDWVYEDGRIEILKGSDENFLKFLCEMIHPIVRIDEKEVVKLLGIFNEHLNKDGFKIVQNDIISGRPIYTYQSYIPGSKHHLVSSQVLQKNLNSSYVDTQIRRLQESIDSDPELAIGTAKEFVETVCKTILEEKQIVFDKNEDLPKLVRLTLKQLKLAAEDIPEHAKAVETIRVMLQNLASISNGLSELRNPYGTGHGKHAKSKGLEPRHARLAVGAATTLAVYIFETYSNQQKNSK